MIKSPETTKTTTYLPIYTVKSTEIITITAFAITSCGSITTVTTTTTTTATTVTITTATAITVVAPGATNSAYSLVCGVSEQTIWRRARSLVCCSLTPISGAQTIRQPND